MKKFYGTLLITSIFIIHTAFRLVCANSYSTNYESFAANDINTKPNSLLYQNDEKSEVFTTSNYSGEQVANPTLARAIFLTNATRENGFMSNY